MSWYYLSDQEYQKQLEARNAKNKSVSTSASN